MLIDSLLDEDAVFRQRSHQRIEPMPVRIIHRSIRPRDGESCQSSPP
jgi:hypothetical protein